MEYTRPEIKDLGDLTDLTRACVGGGPEDDASKTDDNPFRNVSPAFGDPSFCQP